MNADSKFMERLDNDTNNFTLFAPSNAAFEDSNIQSYLSNRTYIKLLLNLHIVNRRLSINDIETESVNKVYNLFNSLNLYLPFYCILLFFYNIFF